MGTPSSMQTRITSRRSIPSSFDSSSGVRWFAMMLPSVVVGKQKARRHDARRAHEVRLSPTSVLGVVLAGAAGISSASDRARKALAVTSFVEPGRRLAPYRDAVARRARLRRAVLFWGSPDTDALEPAAVERFLIGPALHSDTATVARALVADDVREHLGGVRCPCLVLWGARDTQVGIADAV